MENVVYILGAGFSAYAGLPLMKDFYFKSKDMFFDNSAQYRYMERIFKSFDAMAKIKNYYNADLFNIEEILSILEMQQTIGKEKINRKEFIQYIIDVIKYYGFKDDDLKNYKRPGNWQDWIFSKNQKVNEYGKFVCSIGNLVINQMYANDTEHLVAKKSDNSEIKYSIVTFNYDTVIDKICLAIGKNFLGAEGIVESIFDIHRLHGSILNGNIIPPTWSKSISAELKSVWQKAFSRLENASKIRIIGYSLPISDSYVRYYLKSAIMKNERLKEIDVICYDRQGSTKKNYDEFIIFNNYKFINSRVEDYFENINGVREDFGNGEYDISFRSLERGHYSFVNNAMLGN